MRIGIAATLVLVACGGSVAQTQAPDSGATSIPEMQPDSGTTTVVACDASAPSPLRALTWQWNGGDVAWQDESWITPTDPTGAPRPSYSHSRSYPNGGSPPMACEAVLDPCDALMVRIETDLASADVAAAIAHAPVLYGNDPRPVDGALLDIRVEGHLIEVGSCSSNGCPEIPAGVKRLADDLVALDARELAIGQCGQAFHGK